MFLGALFCPIGALDCECKLGSMAALVQIALGCPIRRCVPHPSNCPSFLIGPRRSFTPFLTSLDPPLFLHSI